MPEGSVNTGNTGNEGGSGSGEGGGQGNEGASKGQSFLEFFPEDQREVFKDFNDPNEFVSHYKDLTSKVKNLEGQVPTVPEEYKDPEGLNLDEGSKKAYDGVKEFAKGLGLSQQGFEKLMTELVNHDQDLMNQVKQGVDDGFAQVLEEQKQESERVLKEAWGPEYETKLAQAADFVAASGDQSLVDFLYETGLGNDSAFIQWVYKVSTHFKEDSFVDGKVEENDIKRGPDGRPQLRFPSMTKK